MRQEARNRCSLWSRSSLTELDPHPENNIDILANADILDLMLTLQYEMYRYAESESAL